MNLVDSSGWVEFFGGGENASAFAAAIVDTEALLVPAIVVYEVTKWLMQRRDEEDVLNAYAAMLEGKVVDLDPTVALEAARLSCRHRLPMADSIILATARMHEATVWTQGQHFAGLEGVRYIARQP
ncbi:MAG: PIN domain-containing protein [Anaerolineae bacterium]